MKQRKSYRDVKGKAQAGQSPVRLNTDALYDGGLSRSSDETSVMGVERRAEVVQLELDLPTLGNLGKNLSTHTKEIPITKQMVWDAFKKVRSNRGSAGIDKQTIADYELKLKANLYKLWNRMSSGSYFPVAVKEVSIPKADGKERKLGIPTVSDRIAQEVIKSYLEPRLEEIFSEHSYGYRPLKNSHQAVAEVRDNVQKYAWAIDMDISSFFDNMSHEKVMLALERHVSEKWILMYVKRWLTAPMMDKNGKESMREKGTPQGGVISPLLANLFLHYTFDKWFGQHYPDLSFVRYADDIIVHCNSEEESREVLSAIRERMSACELNLNEEKTKIVYCKTANRKLKFKTVKFDFLGFSFKPQMTKNRKLNKYYLGYNCSISRKSELSIGKEIKETKFHQWTGSTILEIADTFNPKLRGWYNYYGEFQPYKLNRIFGIFNWRLIKWAVKKYKRFNGSMRKAGNWIRATAKSYPNIFVHWQHGFIGA
ncbi:MAG TPA: group II intron reverse transcriptase/maturase [Bacteroidia bacterium]|nr:group II intron reverse transcriptase/maturase [Bacteroidia bacterium]